MNLQEILSPGMTHRATVVATPDLTVQARVPELPPVYSTPNMILFIIEMTRFMQGVAKKQAAPRV
ncbi:MAG: hypothetical protein HYX63_11735 [Gammaproteobacteria bacterium]|nr:hypothetical protein [Gammaproteobacteria bacterium]